MIEKLEFPKCFCRHNQFAINNQWKYGYILIHFFKFKMVIWRKTK